jgi:hypothetical protein
MTQYSSINDVRNNPQVRPSHQEMFQPSRGVEVWYAKKPDFEASGIFVPHETHVLIGVLALPSCEMTIREYLEKLYLALQGECWSPNGEANSLVRRRMPGTAHTSMSVGDIVVIRGGSTGEGTWQCRSVGWLQLD